MTKFFRLVDKMPGGKMWVRSIFLGCFGTKKKQEACIMRLYKKAAAVLLAAAMAVSMMTACGGGAGGNGGNGGNNGSKPGTSEGGEEKPDKPGASVIPADPAKVTWDTSLTKKAFAGISKDNFRFSGLDGSGDAMAYATQGKKMLLLEQESANQFVAFYTPDGKDLYIAVSAEKPDEVSKIKGWMTVEEFAEANNGSAEDVAADKAETLADMTETKEMVSFIDGVKPAAFKAENVQSSNGATIYTERMENVKVGGDFYTYMTAFAPEGWGNYKAGQLFGITRTKGGNVTAIVLGGKITPCDASTFPNVTK